MALRTPAFNDARTYGFEWLRLSNELPLQEGVIAAGDFKVTAAAAGLLRVDVAAGIALVKGDSGVPGTGLSHGLYAIVNDASVPNAVTHVAANATLPRLDQIVLRVRDTSDLGSPADDAVLEVVAGVATAGATLDNRTGAAALPNDAIRLADVLIPAASTVVVGGNVRDRRPWAKGFRTYAQVSTAPTLPAGLTTSVAGFTPTLETRVEVTNGSAIRIDYTGKIQATGINGDVRFRALINGGYLRADDYIDQGHASVAGGFTDRSNRDEAIIGTGSNLVSLTAYAPAGGAVRGDSGRPFILTLQEIAAGYRNNN